MIGGVSSQLLVQKRITRPSFCSNATHAGSGFFAANGKPRLASRAVSCLAGSLITPFTTSVHPPILSRRGSLDSVIGRDGSLVAVQVKRSLGKLSGDISARIQVPLDTGIGLRFDLPYQAIPETGLLSSRCDKHSQVVEVEGRQFCRYCDLCTTSKDVERRLKDSRHKFLADLAQGPEDAGLSQICTEIQEGSYEIHRRLRIPSPEELEKIAKEKFDVDRLSKDLKDRLERKRGRIQVEVRVMSSEPVEKREPEGGACHRCCDQREPCYSRWENHFQRFIVCSRQACREESRSCLAEDAQLVGCSIAEFQYTLTEDKAAVRRFLAEHGIDQSVLDPPTTTAKPRPDPRSRLFGKGGPRRPAPSPRKPSRPSRPQRPRRPPTGDSPEKSRCVGKLRSVHRRICQAFFSSKRAFCCKHCGVCAPLN